MKRLVRIAMCLGLALSVTDTGVAVAAEPIDTTTEVTVASEVPWGTDFTITATVSPMPVPDGGTVTFTIYDADDSPVYSATAFVAGGSAHASLNSQAIGRGSYEVAADFSGNGDWQASSGAGSFVVQGEASELSLSLRAVVEHVIVPGSDVVLWVNVTGAQSGTVEFYETTSGTDVLLGAAPVLQSPYVFGYYTATLPMADITAGPHSFRVDYLGTSRWSPSTDTLDWTVTKAPTTMSLFANLTDPEAPGSVSLSWSVSGERTEFLKTGTVEVRNETTGDLITTDDLSGWVDVPLEEAGSFTFSATYSGDEHYASSVRTRTVTINPDTAHAHGVGVQHATFYPVADGYRDTNRVSGVRDERISVRILIYNAGNAVVRRKTIAMGRGGYAWTWNGRNAAGDLVRAAKYRVVQQLTDTKSNTTRVVDHVTVSRKSLRYSTVTLTKKGSNASAKGSAGVGRARLLSDGSARLTGVSNGKYGWAAVGYQFKMPSAAVYKGMRLAVYGSGQHSTAGPTSLGAQDFGRCAYAPGDDWDDACFTRLRSLATATQWTSASLAGRHRHGRVVRGSISSYSSAIVWTVRLTVTIGVLK
jgi:hypothetical protein